MAAARIFQKLVDRDVLKVLADEDDVYTFVGPRKALGLHLHIGLEYHHSDMYDNPEFPALKCRSIKNFRH